MKLALNDTTFPLQRYKPLQLLGHGSAGSVYFCRDQLLFKNVAVKTIHSASSEALIDFQNEARVTARLRHPGIVQILDFGVVADSVPYMVMEYLPGKTLKKHIEETGRFEPNCVVAIFLQISDALEYAHELGIYHRDLQSANIILNQPGPDAQAHLIDFGLAKVKEKTQALTVVDGKTIIGTPLYMSPDQVNGRAYDRRSEVYSLGCIMFEALTGKTPFEGATALETIAMHVEVEAPSILDHYDKENEILRKLDEVISRCLRKNPDDRYQRMRELHADLLQVLDESVYARPFHTPQKPRTTARRPALLFAALLLPLVSFACFIVKTSPALKDQKPGLSESSAAKLKSIDQFRPSPFAGLYSSKARSAVYLDIKKLIEQNQTRFDLSSFSSASDADMAAFDGYDKAEIIRVKNNFDGTLTEEGLAHIAECKNLKELSIPHASDVTLEDLSSCKQLEFLDLRRASVLDGAADVINKLPNLNHLDLSGATVTDEFFRRLHSFSLTRLELAHVRVSYASINRTLKQCPRLRHVDVGEHIALSVDDLNNLRKSFPKCRILPDSLQSLRTEALHLMVGPHVDFPRAKRLLEKCLMDARAQGGNQRYIGEVLLNLGDCYRMTGDAKRGIATTREGVKIIHGLQPPEHNLEAEARLTLASMLSQLGQEKEAQTQIARSLALTTDRKIEAIARAFRSNILLSGQRWKESEPELKKTVAIADDMQSPALNELIKVDLLKGNLALCKHRLGRQREASQAFRTGLNNLIAFARKNDFYRDAVERLLVEGADTELLLGNYDQALFMNEKARQLYYEHPMLAATAQGILKQRLQIYAKLGKTNKLGAVRAEIERLKGAVK